MEETIVAPLWERLRPQTLNDFLGNPILKNPEAVAALEKRTGPILVHGEIGCGKTSVALVLSSTIVGKRIPHLDGIWNDCNEKVVYGRHLDARTFDIAFFKDSSSLADRLVFIIDEAQDFKDDQITFLRGLVEKEIRKTTYMFVTSDTADFKSRDKGALYSRCYKLHMEPLGVEDRAVLVERGWTAMRKEGKPDALLAAFEKFDYSAPVNQPRIILEVVEAVADGVAPDKAILQSRI